MSFVKEKSAKPTVGYPEGYEIKSIEEQLAILEEKFGIPRYAVATLGERPEKAEGYFVLLKEGFFAENYATACFTVLKKLSESVPVDLPNSKEIISQIKRTEKTKKVLSAIAKQQGGPLFVIPAQTGLLYQSTTPANAIEHFLKYEFGLGVLEGLCILLTHPERLHSVYSIGMDCSGDYFSPDEIPTIEFLTEVRVDKGGKSQGNEFYGTISGFFKGS